MIPKDYITEWRAQAPWVQDFQVEQDLIICKALVDIFSHPLLGESLAFRGGTALYKLFLPPARYSEDIDLVQIRSEPAGQMMKALRDVLDPWLGQPKWDQKDGRVTFMYRFDSEDMPPIRLRLKVEINSREHFSHYGFIHKPFSIASRWFKGDCNICTYTLDELIGTKLRALYQRKKGRDLFDLAIALQEPTLDPERIISAFQEYMNRGGHSVTRTQFEQNMEAKRLHPQFASDISPLLASEFSWDMEAAYIAVSTAFIQRLTGDPWKGNLRQNETPPTKREMIN